MQVLNLAQQTPNINGFGLNAETNVIRTAYASCQWSTLSYSHLTKKSGLILLYFTTDQSNSLYVQTYFAIEMVLFY